VNKNRELAQAYLSFLEGRLLSAGTRKRCRYFLSRFLSWLEDEDLREVSALRLLEYRQYLKTLTNTKGKPLTDATVDLHLLTLKDWFSFLIRSDLLLSNPAENLNFDHERANEHQRPTFGEDEMVRFLESIPLDTAVGKRDRAFFELLYSSGLRFAEASGLLMKELDLSERLIRVTGKGSRQRTVPFCGPALHFLLIYLKGAWKRFASRIRDPELKRFVFLSSKGRVSWKVMRTRFLYYLDRAGLAGRGLTMHSIRHATATHLLAHGAGVRYVQELLGHRSLSSTQIYTHPSKENIKAVYRTFHPRENEFYREVDPEYLKALEELEKEIRAGKEFQRARLKRWAEEGRRPRSKS
jgi:integrase/recombinase XerC